MVKNRNNNNQEFVKSKYDKLALYYDKRWPSYIDKTTKETLKRISIDPQDKVLDIGCGTGSLLHVLSLSGHEKNNIVGIDISKQMLDVARKKLDKSIELIEATVDNLPFSSETFDYVISINSFHYLENPTKSLLEIKRVLKHSGKLVITDWCDDYLLCKLYDKFQCFFSKAHHRTYGSTKCRELLEETGFIIDQIDTYKINWFWGMMTAVAGINR